MKIGRVDGVRLPYVVAPWTEVDYAMDVYSKIIPCFKSREWFDHPKGRLAIVGCDRERSRSDPGLSGCEVMIDGQLFRCIGVERKMPAMPIGQGELIGLVVEALRQ